MSAAFGTVAVASTPKTIPVTIAFNSAEALGGIEVLTQGVAGLDFTLAGGGTCVTNFVYSAKATCTLNVAFRPRRPGPRHGAVVLTDKYDENIATFYLNGVGQG